MRVQESVDAVSRGLQQREAIITYTGNRPDAVIREAMSQEPRLANIIKSLRYEMRSGKGLLSAKTYILHVEYLDQLPLHKEIILDDGKWVLSAAWKAGMRRTLYVVSTTDNEGLTKRLKEDTETLSQVCPVFREWETTIFSGKLSPYVLVFISCKYSVSLDDMNTMGQMSSHAMDQVFRQCFAENKSFVARLPDHVRAFLPFAYIQQNTAFVDQPSDESNPAYDTKADTAYSVLCKHRGSAVGIATAYKEMVERFHLSCVLVTGYAGTGEDRLPHTWCMVKAGEVFHHVDPSFGINGDSVCVDGFFKSDKEMRKTHDWDTTGYPECPLRSPSYHEVMTYINNHYDDFLNAGVEECCFSPDYVEW